MSIYFMQSTEGGPVKIGYSADVDRRREQLEATYGTPLAILAVADGGRNEESEVHARFSHLRFGRSEQFRPALELMEFIGRPLLVDQDPDAVEAMSCHRVAIIHLKGSRQYAAWLEAAYRKTHIAKASIVRLALAEWAARNGVEPPPEL